MADVELDRVAGAANGNLAQPMETVHTEIRPLRAETDAGCTLPAEEKRMLVTGHSLLGQEDWHASLYSSGGVTELNCQGLVPGLRAWYKPGKRTRLSMRGGST